MSKIFNLKFIILIIFISSIFMRNKKSSNSLNKNLIIFETIKHKLQGLIKRKTSYIDSLYIVGKYAFGNFIIAINNAIIFCEYFSCKKIIIKSFKSLFINNKIYYQKYNLTIEPNSRIMHNKYSLIKHLNFFYYRVKFISLGITGNINRIPILREEIINNLPKVKVNPNDLYIYIRGGDIFRRLNRSFKSYVQPPLCFYKNILNNFKFRNIKIISQDKFNPVLGFLEQFYNAKYVKNNIKLDISYLANAYNIVSAKSSFIVSIIKLNNNIKFLWEYDLYIWSKYWHLHYSVYNFSFKYMIYLMKSSEHYKKKMFPFANSKRQRELMIKENCSDNFDIIPPRLS